MYSHTVPPYFFDEIQSQICIWIFYKTVSSNSSMCCIGSSILRDLFLSPSFPCFGDLKQLRGREKESRPEILKGSLLLFYRCWQKTQSPWIRDKGLYYSSYSRNKANEGGLGSPCAPRSMEVTQNGLSEYWVYSGFKSQWRTLVLGKLLLLH